MDQAGSMDSSSLSCWQGLGAEDGALWMLMPTIPWLQALPMGKGKCSQSCPRTELRDAQGQSCAKARPDVCSFFPAEPSVTPSKSTLHPT